MRTIMKDKTAFTSDPFLNDILAKKAIVLVSGTGECKIEHKGADDIFRSYPNLTFTGPIAQDVILPEGEFRVVITAGSATTVEIQL